MADIVVDKVANMVADKVVDMVADKKNGINDDNNINMEIELGERDGHGVG